MAVFVTDIFTDTNGTALTAHTGSLGATWTAFTASGAGVPEINSNTLRASATAGNQMFYASGTPSGSPSADYAVSIDYLYNGDTAAQVQGVGGRIDPSMATGYFFFDFHASGGLSLYRYVTGTLTAIGLSVAFTPISGVGYRLTLEMIGTNISGRVQRLTDNLWYTSAGAWQVSQVNCISQTDSAISAAGKAGIWLTGGVPFPPAFDNFSADDSVATAATAMTMTIGSATGPSGSPSGNITYGANGTLSGTVNFVVDDNGDTGAYLSAATGAISPGTPSITRTYTPSSTGTKTLRMVSNDGGLTLPSNISYISTAPALYTRVDDTDYLGTSIMVLVPGAGATVPYNPANPTRVVLYTHGVGESQDGLVTDLLKADCVEALLDAGYILAGTNDPWGGSQASVDCYAALEKYVRDNYNVVGIAIWSQSMGGLSGLNAISQQKISGLVGWLGTYPVCSLNAVYTGVGGSSFSSGINTAYGITGSGSDTYANKTHGHDPCLRWGSAFRSVHVRFYASPGDTIVGKTANTDAFYALIASSCESVVVVVCTGDHGDPSHFVDTEYVDFFDSCFANPVPTSGIIGAGGEPVDFAF